MLLDRLFRPRAAQAAGRALYARAVEQSRTSGLYADLGAPDTAEGRFEIYSLHVVLLLDRLRGPDGQAWGAAATDVSQALFDAYLKDLDHALRELGVGDLSVGRKMRKLGEAFYGRGKSYEAAFTALPDEAPLQALIVRTVYAETDPASAPRLTAYVLAQRAALASQPIEVLAAGQVAWKPL
ncbi:ubiquinol-cytochrome C chaperone family protein [Phenylobacterium sp.]|uniref:ubiquinol-cytochrome C chaperone family protein n=1 Tax=Phenylobacterium sp. TaxID=1871053 RepID=UPI002BB3B895|nr:ubiquinol-cytochrome C chaperone family protein [Phenylobacterium sp.]HLZ76946.1 ubiquinol-cytochrome C chaperone family protein [Phenylobacterium sp.]